MVGYNSTARRPLASTCSFFTVIGGIFDNRLSEIRGWIRAPAKLNVCLIVSRRQHFRHF